MNKKITSVIFLLATMVVISSSDKLGLPDSFQWPKNTDKLCFAANFTLKLNINYTKSDGSIGSGVIPLNSTTFETYSVSCSAPNNVHQLVISMLNSLTAIVFDFVVDDKDVTSLRKVHGYITLNEQQSIITDYSTSATGFHHFSSNESLFEVGRNKAYQCYSKTEIKGFQTNANLTVVSIDIENLKMKPFADDSKTFDGYKDATQCKADADKNSNLVPIIVGACLAALVVIVLIAYLIGRRRSRTGYQSV